MAPSMAESSAKVGTGAEKTYDGGSASDTVAAARSQRAKQNTATLTAEPSSWVGKSVVSVTQFSTPALEFLFRVTDTMKALVAEKGASARLRVWEIIPVSGFLTTVRPDAFWRNITSRDSYWGRVLGTLFYENSTRTSCSFQAAMLRLGGTFLAVNAASSSVKKGETLEDTVTSMLCYCDAIALRHPAKGAAWAAAGVAKGPVLNAGDGVGEHPTQALLDLYTIQAELPGAEGLSGLGGKVIVMVGDLKHGRTVHSLAKLLATFGCVFRYVSPSSLRMPREVLDKVSECSPQGSCVDQTEHEALGDVLEGADVIYVTRIQQERFASKEEFEAVNGCYRITPEVMDRAKSSAVLMHPLPRVGEIAEDCDLDPRAAYFRQMENGMFVRMALLLLLLGESDCVLKD